MLSLVLTWTCSVLYPCSVSSSAECKYQLNLTSAQHCVGFDPNGAYVASGSRVSSDVHIFSTLDGSVAKHLVIGSQVRSLQFSPDGSQIAIASSGQQVFIYAVGFGWSLVRNFGLSSPVNDVAYTPDSKRLLAATDGGFVSVLDPVVGGPELLRFTEHTGGVMSVSVNPSGEYAISGSEVPNEVRVWSILTGGQKYAKAQTNVVSVAWSGVDAVVAGAGSELVLSAVSSGAELHTFPSIGDVLGVAFSSARPQLAAVAKGDVHLFNTGTYAAEGMYTGHTDVTTDVAYSADGTLIITCSEDMSVRIWSVTSASPAPPTPSPPTSSPPTSTPPTPSPPTPSPPTPAPLTLSPTTPAPQTPSPPTSASLTPSPPTPSPPTASPPTSAPPTPSPPTPVPLTPSPPTSTPPTPAPATLAPLTPSPPTPSPPTPSPPTPAPLTLSPTTPSPPTASPPTSAPATSTPLTPSPVPLAPVTLATPTSSPLTLSPTSAPASPSPPTPAPATRSPATSAPASPAPPTSAPATSAPPTPAPPTAVPATPSPASPAPPTSSPLTLSPTSAPASSSPVTPSPPTLPPLTLVPVTPSPSTPAPLTPSPATLSPLTSAPVTAAPPTLSPLTSSPPTTAPLTPSPATPAPPTLPPLTLTPATPAPVTSAPLTLSPATPAPPTSVPLSPAPSTPSPPALPPLTPAPRTLSPLTSAPVTAAPPTLSPLTPAPPTPAPLTPSPATPAPPTLPPLTLVPVTPSPSTPAPLTPSPATLSPLTSAPVTAAPPTLSPLTSSPPTTAPLTPSPATLPPTALPSTTLATSAPSRAPTTPATSLSPTLPPQTTTPAQPAATPLPLTLVPTPRSGPDNPVVVTLVATATQSKAVTEGVAVITLRATNGVWRQAGELSLGNDAQADITLQSATPGMYTGFQAHFGDEGFVRVEVVGQDLILTLSAASFRAVSDDVLTITVQPSAFVGTPLTHSVPLQYTIQRAEPDIAPEVKQSVQTAAFVTGVTAPLGATRTLSFVHLLDCPMDLGAGKMSWTENPLQVSLAGYQSPQRAGAVLGNAALVAAFLAVHFVVVLLVWCTKGPDGGPRTLVDSMRRARFPSYCFVPAMLFAQATVESAVHVLQSEDTFAQKLLPIAGLLTYNIACLAGVHYILTPAVFPAEFEESEVPNSACRKVLRFFSGKGDWRGPQKHRFVGMFGLTFRDFWPRARRFMLLEMGFSFSVGVINGFEMRTVNACRVQLSILLVLYVPYVIILAVRRPYHSTANNICAIGGALMQTLAIFCMLLNALGANTSSAAVGLLLASLLFLIPKALIEITTMIYDLRERDELHLDEAGFLDTQKDVAISELEMTFDEEAASEANYTHSNADMTSPLCPAFLAGLETQREEPAPPPTPPSPSLGQELLFNKSSSRRSLNRAGSVQRGVFCSASLASLSKSRGGSSNNSFSSPPRLLPPRLSKTRRAGSASSLHDITSLHLRERETSPGLDSTSRGTPTVADNDSFSACSGGGGDLRTSQKSRNRRNSSPTINAALKPPMGSGLNWLPKDEVIGFGRGAGSLALIASMRMVKG